MHRIVSGITVFSIQHDYQTLHAFPIKQRMTRRASVNQCRECGRRRRMSATYTRHPDLPRAGPKADKSFILAGLIYVV